MTRRRTPPLHRRPPGYGFDRLHIFVPAIMSVGLLFWIVTLTRDLFRWQGERSWDRRARAAGRATATFVLGDLGPPAPAMPGLRLRVSYLVTALVAGTISMYVLIGSTANYLLDGGYVGDIAWLMALSLLVAAVFGFVAGISLTVFIAWPHPPAVLHGILRATPLTSADEPGEAHPSWALSTATNLMPVVAVVFTIMVGSARSALVELDLAARDWASWADLDGQADVGRSVGGLAGPRGGAAHGRCGDAAVPGPGGLPAGVDRRRAGRGGGRVEVDRASRSRR